MPRPPKPPTFWDRHGRKVALALFVLAIFTAVLGQFGVAGLIAFAALGLATFTGGAPRSGDGTYESGIGINGGTGGV